MDRPVRQSRQRISTSGLIGLLPQEEAAINRALHESLLQEKKKSPARHKQQATSSRSVSETSTSYNAHSGNQDDHTVKVENSKAMECDRFNESSTSKSPAKRRRRLHSPTSPSHSLDYSSESKSSSPTNGGTFRGNSSSSLSSPRSVESSLKLVLSTSSWSRSSSSSWSPTPEPIVSNKSGKGVTQKSNKVQLLPKMKKTVESKVKGKRGRPRKYPLKGSVTLSKSIVNGKNVGTVAPKIGKAPKTYTKAALQFHGALLSKKKQQNKTGKLQQQKSKPKKRYEHVCVSQRSTELDVPPLSPEAALVLHDHCYSGGAMSHASTAVEDETTTSSDTKCSAYSAQRKFAQHRMPNCTPTRPHPDEVESVSGLKEVPKTEDFITFLCLRGSDSIPKELEKFSFPWTQFQQRRPKSGHEGPMKRKALGFTALKGIKPKSRNVARKMGDSVCSRIPALIS